MKPIKLLVILLVISTLNVSCVPRTNLKPIPNQSEPQNFMGLFEIMPPQGDNWFEGQRAAGFLSYGKYLDSRKHTFATSVHVSKIDEKFNDEKEFLTFIKTLRAADSNPIKFRNMSHEEVLDTKHGKFCTRYNLEGEEIGKGILEMIGYTCLHPKHPTLVVTISYSERTAGVKGNRVGKNIRSEGEGFINSLKFN